MTNFPLRKPAIRARQPIGELFLCSLPARLLLKVAYSIPAAAKADSAGLFSLLGIQRKLSVSRAKEIGAYIDNEEATFPNTIILSVNYSEDGQYEEDESLRWRVVESKEKERCHFLVIPSGKRLASIIDGQHRLEGFKYVAKDDRLDMELPCGVFINLPRAYQANIFATINFNQKRVDKSLAYQLFGYDLQESNRAKWPPDMLALFIARVLNSESESPFHNHVRLAVLEVEGEEDKEEVWQVSIATLVEGISKLISSKPTADRNALLQGVVSKRSGLRKDDPDAPLRDLYLDGRKDSMIYRLVAEYFEVVAKVLWDRAEEGSFITRTVGILALFDILRLGLLRERVTVKDMRKTAKELIAPAARIDFADNFFHASGAGRVRIRKVLEYATDLREPEEVGREVVAEGKRLLKS